MPCSSYLQIIKGISISGSHKNTSRLLVKYAAGYIMDSQSPVLWREGGKDRINVKRLKEWKSDYRWFLVRLPGLATSYLLTSTDWLTGLIFTGSYTSQHSVPSSAWWPTSTLTTEDDGVSSDEKYILIRPHTPFPARPIRISTISSTKENLIIN